MKTVYAFFFTDAWHTKASKELIFISSTRKMGMILLKRYMKKHKCQDLSIDDIEDLERINQTLGREENIMIDPFILNEI